MIVKIQNRGHSFKGLAAYLLNPKRDDPENAERVAWSETGNMYTNDIEQAAKVMAWTDENADHLKANAGVSNTGAKRTLGGVYHYSLAWAHDEKPDQEHQRQAALETIKKHGLEGHEFFMVAHDDTDHAHIHIVVNLTSAEDGTRHKLGLNKRAMSDWALEYEQQHGIHCEMRITNRIEAQQLGHNIKHQEQKQDYAPEVTAAYKQSDNGQAFLAALNESGLTLAQGRKRLVLVDGHGEIHALARQVDGANTKEIKAKLSDVDLKSLVDADELRREILERLERAKEQEETEREHKKERDLQHDRSYKTTGEIAQDYIDLAHDPLQDVRRWMDESGTGQGQRAEGSNILLAGQAGSAPLVGELQQVRKPTASERAAGSAEGNTEQKNSDSRQSIEGRGKPELDENKARKYAEIQKRIDAKTAESRAKHNIDELQEQQREAQNRLNELSGFWARHVFKREEFKTAEHDAWAIGKTLERQQERFRADIEAINRNRPKWLIERELSNHGINDDQNSAGGEGSEGIKTERENVVLKEAQSSPEAAARLSDQVQAKTPKQAAQVAQVRYKAETFKAEKTAAHNREIAEREAKEQQRQKPRYSAAQVAEYQRQREAERAQAESVEQSTIKPEFEQSARAQELEARAAEIQKSLDDTPDFTAQLDNTYNQYQALGDDMSAESQRERERLALQMADIEREREQWERMQQEQGQGYDYDYD